MSATTRARESGRGVVEPASPTGVAAAVTVVVSDDQAAVEIDADRWAQLAGAVADAEGGVGELTLAFVTADDIAELNRDHMDGDGPTDVLAFPLDALDDGPLDAAASGPRLLGDVVICPSVAAAQAPEHAGTLDDELALLVVHGCLHVFGYDHAHDDDTARMRHREVELLREHHWDGTVPAEFRQEHA